MGSGHEFPILPHGLSRAHSNRRRKLSGEEVQGLSRKSVFTEKTRGRGVGEVLTATAIPSAQALVLFIEG